MAYNILLVDDDKEFRYEFSCFFEDYNFIEASNGEEALSALEKPNEIDLVILDVIIPGIKGTQVLKRIKEKYPSMGVIILTGYSSKDIAIDALKGKADDFIEKPVDVKKTRLSIENLLIGKKNSFSDDDMSIKSKMEKITAFIMRNSQKKILLDDVAKFVFLSPKYLSRVFKDEMGIGFKEFVLNSKINEAKKVLSDTEKTINEISYGLGYKNTESFIKIFKKETGLTPTEYREKEKRNV
jgi:YesN/AraC family two-component response regulator